MTDTERLHEHIQRSGYKLNYLAQEMGICPNTLRLKLLGESEFKVSEAQKLAERLALSEEERKRCFWS